MLETKRSSAAAALLSVAAFGAASLPSAQADGAALKSLSMYGDAQTLSNDPMYKWSAAVSRTDSTGYHIASAVAIAPDVYITAGHFTPINGSTTAAQRELIFGSNYNTSTDKYQVSRTQRFPGFVFDDPTTTDLGIGFTTTFIQGFDKQTTFSSIPLGAVGTMVDYGNIGDPTTGELPSLGDRLAGLAPRVTSNTSAYPASKYYSFNFNGIASQGIPLNVQGLNFSSGAPWYDNNGNLAGLLIAKTNGISIGESVVLNLNTPEIQSYLQPIIQDSWSRYNATVPEPSSISLLGAAAFGLASRRRRTV